MKITKPQDIKRKQIVIAVGGFAAFVGILVFGLWVSDPHKGEKTVLEKRREAAQVHTKDFSLKQNVSAKDMWVAKSEERLKSQGDAVEDLTEKNDRLLKQVEDLAKLVRENNMRSSGQDYPQASTPVVGNVPDVDILSQQPSNPTVTFPPAPGQAMSKEQVIGNMFPTRPSNNANNGSGQSTQAAESVFHISLVDSEADNGENNSKNADTYIPAGSFATAIMLAGVDAPTGGLAQTNPSPVLFRVKEDARLPNFWRAQTRECHIIGEAAGNMASERAEIRLLSLSCVLSTGDIIEKKIKGWVTGEDGKAGVRGKVISKQGRLIAMAAASGIFAGFGQSVDQQYSQVSSSPLGTVSKVDPSKVFQSGAAKGFSNSMDKISEFYMERANETYPIIEVSAKRVVEIVLSEGVDLGEVSLSGNTLGYDDY